MFPFVVLASDNSLALKVSVLPVRIVFLIHGCCLSGRVRVRWRGAGFVAWRAVFGGGDLEAVLQTDGQAQGEHDQWLAGVVLPGGLFVFGLLVGTLSKGTGLGSGW